MDTLIVVAAQYLLYVILVTSAVVWLCLPRHDKVGLGVQAIVSLGIVLGLARMAPHVHHAQDIAAGVLIALLAVGIAEPGLPPTRVSRWT